MLVLGSVLPNCHVGFSNPNLRSDPKPGSSNMDEIPPSYRWIIIIRYKDPKKSMQYN